MPSINAEARKLNNENGTRNKIEETIVKGKYLIGKCKPGASTTNFVFFPFFGRKANKQSRLFCLHFKNAFQCFRTQFLH